VPSSSFILKHRLQTLLLHLLLSKQRLQMLLRPVALMHCIRNLSRVVHAVSHGARHVKQALQAHMSVH